MTVDLGKLTGHDSPAMSDTSSNMLKTFAPRLIVARRAAGFKTQTALAEAMGLTFHAISVWEKGRNFPRVPDLYKLSQLLGVTTDWLIAGEKAGLSGEAWRRLEAARSA
jgi:transcriptional regulator with XRE-family HTH domain